MLNIAYPSMAPTFCKIKAILIAFVTGLSLSVLPSFGEQPPANPEISIFKLSERKSDVFDTFQLAEGIRLSNFKKVYIEDVSARFEKDWLRDHRIDTSKQYREKILQRYPEKFKEKLEEALGENEHLEIVKGSGEGVLTLSVNVNDLDIYAPDGRSPSTKKYVKNAGRAKLTVEMKNSAGDVVAKIADIRETRDRQPHELEITNSLLNERDFKWMFRIWSRYIAEHLAEN